MDEKRRSLLKIFAKGCGVLGMGAAGAAVVSAASGTVKPFLGSGEGVLKVDRYEADAQEEIQSFMEHYQIPDPDKAKELYRKIVTEMSMHGVGGGAIGELISQLANVTFGKGNVTGAFTSIVTAPWIAEGVARATHETFLDEGIHIITREGVVEVNQETFFLDQDKLVSEYGLSLKNASRLCDDCQQLSYGEAGLVARVVSAAEHAMQWSSKAWSKRKEAVAAKESLAGDADFCAARGKAGQVLAPDIDFRHVGTLTSKKMTCCDAGDDVVDAEFQEIKMGKNGEYVPVDDKEEPLP